MSFIIAVMGESGQNPPRSLLASLERETLENNVNTMLPDDVERAVLVGRVWRDGVINGPCVVAVRNG